MSNDENSDTDARSSSAEAQSCAQAEHTPGPWRLEGVSIVRDDPLRPDEYWVVAMPGDSAPSNPHAEGHKPSDLGVGHKTIEANARLIAAAPELLAAAKKARDLLENDVEWGHPSKKGSILNDLQGAIAKAEGEA